MVFYDFSLTVGQSRPVILPWQAEIITVQNLTQYTLLINKGSDSIPQRTTDAGVLIVPPLGLHAIPVLGKLFGFLLADTPALSNAPPGMPETCQISISAGERAPAFASAELASIYLATEQQEIVDQASGRAAGPYSDGPYAVPANMRTLVITDMGAGITLMTVQGAQSGHIYWRGNPDDFGGTAHRIITAFFPALDDEIEIVTSSDSTSNGYRIYAAAEPYTPESVRADGRQKVDVIPPGETAIPVEWGSTLPVNQDANAAVTYLAAAARTTFTIGAGISLNGRRGITIRVNVTAAPGAQTLLLQLFHAGGSSAYWLATVTITGTGEWVYHLGPGAAGTPTGTTRERVAQTPIDGTLIAISPSGAGSWTYSVNYWLHW